MRRQKLFLLLAVLTFAVVAPVSSQDFSGQTVVVVTQTGSAIGGPVLDKGPIWEEATGGNIELQTFAFGELFEKIVTALSTGSGDLRCFDLRRRLGWRHHGARLCDGDPAGDP